MELEAHAEVSNRLCRLDEGAADVVASNEAKLEGQTSCFGVSERSGDPAIRDGNDDVCFDRLIFGERPSHALAGFVDADAVEPRVRPGKIHVLENAHVSPFRVHAEGAQAAHPCAVDDDHFTRLDVADELGTDQLKGRGLGRDHVRPIQLAEAKRTEAIGVANRHELVWRKKNQ